MVPKPRSAEKAASSCQKVSSAFLLCLQLCIPIFFLRGKSGHLVHLKMYPTKQNSCFLIPLVPPSGLQLGCRHWQEEAAGSLGSSLQLHLTPKLVNVMAELKKAFRPGLRWLLIQLVRHRGCYFLVWRSKWNADGVACSAMLLSGCNMVKYHQGCIIAKGNAGFKQRVLL